MASAKTRARLSVVLLLLGGLATLVAALCLYVNAVAQDRERFADHVTEAVRAPAVSKEISARLADAVVGAVPDAVIGERPLRDAAASLISNGTLDPIVRRAALGLHDSAFTDQSKNLSLDLADGLQLVGSFVAAQQPELRSRLTPEINAKVVSLKQDSPLTRLASAASAVRVMAWLLPALAALLFVAAVVAARDRGRALGRVGLAIAGAGLGVFVVEVLVIAAVQRLDVAEPEAVFAAVEVFLSGLSLLAVSLLAAGGLIAAAGAGRLTNQTAEHSFTKIRAFLISPATPRARAVRAPVLVILGALLLLEPLPTLETFALVAGFFVLVEGLTEAVALLGGGRAEPETTRSAPVAARHRWVTYGVSGLGVAALLLIAGVGLFGSANADSSLTLKCNGSERLCDRPLDAVALPAAHNAMSSADAGFVDPNQRRTIVGQLDAGIRGLLVDGMLAQPVSRPASALTVLDGEVRKQAEAEVGVGGIAALQDFLARRVTKPTGPAAPFFCHMVCELGALPMTETLAEINAWLDEHPHEVLVIVIQDLVTPAQVKETFAGSGLDDRVYTWRAGRPAPTLRQMIDADRRVLVMAEAAGLPNSWYPAGYASLLKETPYDHPTVESLDRAQSCRANRGNEANPLFLVNHWVAVYPPRPSKAAVVNQREFMLRRVERCRKLRRAFPNLLAVDFADVGDVVGVAAAINGVPRPPATSPG